MGIAAATAGAAAGLLSGWEDYRPDGAAGGQGRERITKPDFSSGNVIILQGLERICSALYNALKRLSD